MAQAKSIYGYAQDLPTDSVTGCVQSDYQCQQTFYLKQQTEILKGQQTNQQLQQENTQLKTNVESLQKEVDQLKTVQQTSQAQPSNNLLTASALNAAAPSLVVGLVIGAVVAIIVSKKYFSKVWKFLYHSQFLRSGQ